MVLNLKLSHWRAICLPTSRSLKNNATKAFCAFTQSDLQGKWKALIAESELINAIVSNATYEIDENGNFLTGTTIDNSEFKSGKLNIDDNGVIKGNYKSTTTSFNINKAKMNDNKNLIDGTYITDSDTFGKFSYIQVPTNSNINISDLSGKWTMINYESDYNEEFLSHGFIDFDNSGNIVDSKAEYTNGNIGYFLSSSISITDAGKISGYLKNNQGNNIFIMNGQLNSDKNLIIMNFNTDVGTYGITYLVKHGNTFQTSDLAANWHGTAIEGLYNLDLSFHFDTIKLNSKGNLLESSYTVLNGVSGDYKSASLDLNTQGKMSGNVINDQGGESTIIAGKLSSSKDVGIYAFESDSWSAGGGVYIKGKEVSNDNTDNGSSSSGCIMYNSATFDYSWVLLLIIPALITRKKLTNK